MSLREQKAYQDVRTTLRTKGFATVGRLSNWVVAEAICGNDICAKKFDYKRYPNSKPREFCSVNCHMRFQREKRRKVPQDYDLLYDLYWTKNMSTTEMAKHFGTKSHKVVTRIMQLAGVPIRRGGLSRLKHCIKEGCQKPIFKIRHKGNGSNYGRLCRRHWNEHRARLAANERTRPHVRERLRKAHATWYYVGLSKPKNEKQEVIHARRMLRAVKRVLVNPERTPDAILSEKLSKILSITPQGGKEKPSKCLKQNRRNSNSHLVA